MTYRPPDAGHRRESRNDPAPGTAAGPILSEGSWTGRPPSPHAHVALVVVYHKGDHEVMWPHARHRVSLARRPTTLYEVDLSLHQATIEADVPSRTDASPFHAEVTIQWRVTDPSAIVRHRVTDAAEALSPHLLHRIRGITRNHDIGESSAAEDAVNEQLGGAAIGVGEPGKDHHPGTTGGLGAEYGLWTRVIAQLTLNEAAADHKAKMAKLRWARDEEQAEHELRLQQEQNRQRITADRMDVYRQIIAAGDSERFAYQLAEHPDDIAAIEKIIREEQRISRRDTIDFVAHMVDSGVIERWQINDEVKEALAWLREATARVIPDKSQQDNSPDRRERRQGRTIVNQAEIEPELAASPPNGQGSSPEHDSEDRLD